MRRVGSPAQREIWIGAALVVLLIVVALVVWRGTRDPEAAPAASPEHPVPADTVAAALVETVPAPVPTPTAISTEALPVPWPANESAPLSGDTPRAESLLAWDADNPATQVVSTQAASSTSASGQSHDSG